MYVTKVIRSKIFEKYWGNRGIITHSLSTVQDPSNFRRFSTEKFSLSGWEGEGEVDWSRRVVSARVATPSGAYCPSAWGETLLLHVVDQGNIYSFHFYTV